MEAKPYGLYCATFDLNFPSILNVAHITSLLDTETKKIFIFNILVYVIIMNYLLSSFFWTGYTCADENFFSWIDICEIQINKYYYSYQISL